MTDDARKGKEGDLDLKRFYGFVILIIVPIGRVWNKRNIFKSISEPSFFESGIPRVIAVSFNLESE